MATRRRSSKVIWMRSGWSSASICWVLLVSGRFGLCKTIIPEAGSTFLPFQHAATLISSVDWGLMVIFRIMLMLPDSIKLERATDHGGITSRIDPGSFR